MLPPAPQPRPRGWPGLPQGFARVRRVPARPPLPLAPLAKIGAPCDVAVQLPASKMAAGEWAGRGVPPQPGSGAGAGRAARRDGSARAARGAARGCRRAPVQHAAGTRPRHGLPGTGAAGAGPRTGAAGAAPRRAARRGPGHPTGVGTGGQRRPAGPGLPSAGGLFPTCKAASSGAGGGHGAGTAGRPRNGAGRRAPPAHRRDCPFPQPRAAPAAAQRPAALSTGDSRCPTATPQTSIPG